MHRMQGISGEAAPGTGRSPGDLSLEPYPGSVAISRGVLRSCLEKTTCSVRIGQAKRLGRCNYLRAALLQICAQKMT